MFCAFVKERRHIKKRKDEKQKQQQQSLPHARKIRKFIKI